MHSHTYMYELVCSYWVSQSKGWVLTGWSSLCSTFFYIYLPHLSHNMNSIKNFYRFSFANFIITCICLVPMLFSQVIHLMTMKLNIHSCNVRGMKINDITYLVRKWCNFLKNKDFIYWSNKELKIYYFEIIMYDIPLKLDAKPFRQR